MNRLKDVTARVKRILEVDEQARNSDSFLYLKVIAQIAAEKHRPELLKAPVDDYLIHMGEWGFPPFESVRRARQKLQRRYPDLAACEKVQEARSENEQEYFDYAISEV